MAKTKSSLGQYPELLEVVPDAMVAVDRNSLIVLLNTQAEAQFGYHRDELIGQKVNVIIKDGFTADSLLQQAGSGIELIGRRKDGHDFPSRSG